MGQVGVGICKVVDTLGQGQDAFGAVGDFERCQFECADELVFHLVGGILGLMLVKQTADGFGHVLVVQVQVVVGEGLFIFALRVVVVTAAVVVECSHILVF